MLQATVSEREQTEHHHQHLHDEPWPRATWMEKCLHPFQPLRFVVPAFWDYGPFPCPQHYQQEGEKKEEREKVQGAQ